MLKKTYWFIFNEGKILLAKGAVPLSARPPVPAAGAAVHDIGFYRGCPCKTFAAPRPPEKFIFEDLRASHALLPAKLFALAGKAAQVLYWDSNSRRCPCCGALTNVLAHNAKICPECKKEIYPHIAAAVMVLVRRGDEILMARGHNFRKKYYGLVAGFLETGETLEECCAREVLEETNLKIKNIRYFASQPWPFPSGMMIGFTADYKSGMLRPDGKELAAAQFFNKNNLPPLPGKISLARKMVDAWRKGQK